MAADMLHEQGFAATSEPATVKTADGGRDTTSLPHKTVATILRPPLANDRLSILDDGNVRLEFKRPWLDGTSSVEMDPLALIARLAALVPPPRRQLRTEGRVPAPVRLPSPTAASLVGGSC